MIYRSQEPLRILGDLSDDVEIKVARISEDNFLIRKGGFRKKGFEELPRLENPLKIGDVCYLYANSQFYVVNCDGR